MNKDIRKLPKVKGKRETGNANVSFGSQSATPIASASASSDSGNGETTAVEDHLSIGRVTVADQLQAPPISSFKKKRTRSYAPGHAPGGSKHKYWSEYDNPSDSDEEGAYVLYVDPNAESSLGQTWRKLIKMFNRGKASGKQPLLQNTDDGLSSSDEEALLPRRGRIGQQQTYGTLEAGTGLDGATIDVSRSCLLYTSPSPRDGLLSRMPSSA